MHHRKTCMNRDAMKISVMITFENERVSAIPQDRIISFDGMVPLPSVGERVQNPSAGLEGQPICGKLVSRSFTYRPNEVSVILTLQEY